MHANVLRKHSKPLAGIGYIALILLLILLSVKAFQKDLPWQSAATITLQTSTPGLELNPHSDVKFQGLLVGEVRSITSDGRTATIELSIDPGSLDLLPANVDAAIVPKTLFGEKFVDLRLPKAPETARLVAGGVISESTTSVEIGALFSKLVPVLDALKPAQLSIILNSLAQALNGRGQRLANSLNQIQGFLTKVDPHLDTFTHDIGQFAKTSDIYAASAPDLLRVLSSTAAISRELLIPKEKDFSAALAQLIATSGDTQHVLAQNAENLIRLSGRSRPLLALLDQYSTALPCFLTGLHRFGILTDQAIGARGPFTNLVIDIAANNAPYTNPKDLPSTPTSDGNNANLPFGIPNDKPHCPQFSSEVLALKDAGTNSMPFDGQAIQPVSATGSTPASAPSEVAVDSARTALARALAAQSLGVPVAKVPGFASLLVGPMLTDGRVDVR
jgi:phospholipid/cholesterol/gamma-HCH transport system substrate-binding protein